MASKPLLNLLLTKPNHLGENEKPGGWNEPDGRYNAGIVPAAGHDFAIAQCKGGRAVSPLEARRTGSAFGGAYARAETSRHRGRKTGCNAVGPAPTLVLAREFSRRLRSFGTQNFFILRRPQVISKDEGILFLKDKAKLIAAAAPVAASVVAFAAFVAASWSAGPPLSTLQCRRDTTAHSCSRD